jgi:hypothetical protein
MWNVEVMEALEWIEYIMDRRYEWLKMVNRFLGGKDDDTPPKKKCSHETICSMCGKQCRARVSSSITVH